MLRQWKICQKNFRRVRGEGTLEFWGGASPAPRGAKVYARGPGGGAMGPAPILGVRDRVSGFGFWVLPGIGSSLKGGSKVFAVLQ